MTATCSTCKHWEPLDHQWGTCSAIPDGNLLTSPDTNAYAEDAEGYKAWLSTRSDFGCINHQPTHQPNQHQQRNHAMTHYSTMNQPLAHSITDAATRIGVGRTTMYALIDAGEIETITIGRRHLVTETALVAFIEARSRAGQTQGASPVSDAHERQ